MVQICFILVRISFFPCKQNYTVILSTETLRRKSLLWIPRKFPLIILLYFIFIVDFRTPILLPDTPWNQALPNQCLPPERIVGPRAVLGPPSASPQEHSKESHFYLPRFQHLSTHTYEKNNWKFPIGISSSGCSYQPWKKRSSREKVKENPANICR